MYLASFVRSFVVYHWVLYVRVLYVFYMCSICEVKAPFVNIATEKGKNLVHPVHVVQRKIHKPHLKRVAFTLPGHQIKKWEKTYENNNHSENRKSRAGTHFRWR